MRRINWDDEELTRYAIRCLTAAWNVRYNSIHCLANLVSGLALYHEEIGIFVVDAVIEDIRIGLEVNMPKFNQRRVSMIKYLGELYNYRMVESSIIFKVLYTLITYGVAFDANEATKPESLDPSDNFFRVRLVCVMLDTCGQYFDRGNTKKKLDCFLIYFMVEPRTHFLFCFTYVYTNECWFVLKRYYLFKKETAVGDDESKPSDRIDVEFTLTEAVMSLRPSFKFAKNYQAACEAVAKMEDDVRESLNKTCPGLLNEVSYVGSAGSVADDGLSAIKEVRFWLDGN